MQPSCSQPLHFQRLQACHQLQQRHACPGFPTSQHLPTQHLSANHLFTTHMRTSAVPQSCHSTSSGFRIKPLSAAARSTAGGIPKCLQQHSLGRQPLQLHSNHQKPWQQQDRCVLTHASRHMAGGLPMAQITVSCPALSVWTRQSFMLI